MGFSDQEIVALAGAHALGYCHKDVSGYVGAWTPTPNKFNNLYFVLLLNLNWEPNTVNGKLQYGVAAENGRKDGKEIRWEKVAFKSLEMCVCVCVCVCARARSERATTMACKLSGKSRSCLRARNLLELAPGAAVSKGARLRARLVANTHPLPSPSFRCPHSTLPSLAFGSSWLMWCGCMPRLIYC
jgi:hypothetical protein